MTPGPPLTPGTDLATQGGEGWGQLGYFRLWAGNLGCLPGPMFLACREAQAIWYLAGSRQEVQLNIRIGQAVGVHGLQSLQKKRQWCEGLGRAGHSAAAALGAGPGLCPARRFIPCASSSEERETEKSPGIRQMGFKARPCHVLAVCPPASFLTCLSLVFLAGQMGCEQPCFVERGEFHTISPVKRLAHGDAPSRLDCHSSPPGSWALPL